jgi:acyl-coenzyme A synthetase/AMP-(fatty) acid ligase
MSNFDLLEHLAFRAKLDPQGIALCDSRRSMNFSRLLTITRNVAAKLRTAGIRPGQTVVTVFPDRYWDWIFTLALLHEATVTCSLGAPPTSSDSSLDPAWIITTRDHPSEHDRHLVVDKEWMEDIWKSASNIEHQPYASASARARIVLTSGTTGSRKAVALTIGQVMARSLQVLGSTPVMSSFNLMAMSTVGGFTSAVARLINGTPVYCASHIDELIEVIERFSVQDLVASPIQLSHLIDQLERRAKPLSGIKRVRYAGSSASPTLLQRIQQYLSTNVYNVYGSTEASATCMYKPTDSTDPRVIGYPEPGVTLEIVDDDDRKLGLGQEGNIRIRTVLMADGYLNTLEHQKAFRDGWFYPGDRGLEMPDGLIVSAGRSNEVINMGGIKIDPTAIDHFLLSLPGIRDAAAFSTVGERGQPLVMAAIVTEAHTPDLDDLSRRLSQRLGNAVSSAALVQVSAIPRNQMGKVLRHVLATEHAPQGPLNQTPR